MLVANNERSKMPVVWPQPGLSQVTGQLDSRAVPEKIGNVKFVYSFYKLMLKNIKSKKTQS